MKRTVGSVVWAVSLVLCGSAGADSGSQVLQRFESTQPQMGVPFKIILYVADETTAKGAFEAAFSRIAQLNRCLSDYDPDSELSRLSRDAPHAKPVPLSDDLWRVLTASQSLAARTGGAFDVTVGPYIRLWRRARRAKEMPSPERLAEARAAIGYQFLRLDEARQSAQLDKPHMRLDLGGIAMGYAVDEALRTLRERGITRVLIDGSGDIGVGDPPPGKTGWSIGIVPLSAEGTPSRQVLLQNAAVTTSGDAFQHVEIDGQRYSHIVNPRTGLGLTDRSGVTVIAKDCLSADSLATTCSVLGPKDALELIESIPGAAVFIVQATEDEPRTWQSKRFDEYTVRPEMAVDVKASR